MSQEGIYEMFEADNDRINELEEQVEALKQQVSVLMQFFHDLRQRLDAECPKVKPQ